MPFFCINASDTDYSTEVLFERTENQRATGRHGLRYHKKKLRLVYRVSRNFKTCVAINNCATCHNGNKHDRCNNDGMVGTAGTGCRDTGNRRYVSFFAIWFWYFGLCRATCCTGYRGKRISLGTPKYPPGTVVICHIMPVFYTNTDANANDYQFFWDNLINWHYSHRPI